MCDTTDATAHSAGQQRLLLRSPCCLPCHGTQAKVHSLRFAPQVWIIHLCGPDVEEVHNSPGVLWRMAVQICSGNRDISCAVRLDDAMENIPVGLGVFQATSIPLLRASQTQ